MSRRDDELAHRLDRRFEEILARVKPYLLRMPASGEARLCRAWLERLNRAGDQPNLRNDYLHELHKQLKISCLRSPFNKLPEPGRLIPLSTCHRLVMSSSCNELTETSQSLCEQKPNWVKPRSRSLRRDASARRSRIPSRRCDAHSSSPRRSSRLDDSSTPTAHFCEQDTRSTRLLASSLFKYKERIEMLSGIVEELENQNEALRQKLIFFHKASSSDEIPHLRNRINQLMSEIASLKMKLSEVVEIKTALEQNHLRIVEQYKKKMTENFVKMKEQLEHARHENQGLNNKLSTIEKRLQELSLEKEESVKMNEKEWVNKLVSVKSNYEKTLEEKEGELKKKDEILQQKESELHEKLTEIDGLHRRVEKLQKLVETKAQDEGKLQALLVEQYNTIKEELSKMRCNIELASTNQVEISTLKKDLQRVEKITQKQQQEYEKKVSRILKEKNREIMDLQMWMESRYYQHLFPPQEHGEITGKSWNNKYKALLDCLENKATDERNKISQRMAFIDSQMCRLRKSELN